jgi:DNA-binding transcriptional LysR family regulator
LSPEGEALFARCQKILEEVAALEAAAAGAHAGPSGILRIDMPVSYGREVVLPVLSGLVTSYPELKIDARFSDEIVDIIKEGVDAAVRIGPLTDSRLIARAFDEQVIGTFASPAYIERQGNPTSPEVLSKHACLLFRMPSTGRDRPWQFRHGKRNYSLQPDGKVRLGDGEALVRTAVAGLGLVQVPRHMAQAELGSGRLVEVLQAFAPNPAPISLVYPSQRYVPLRVRALAEALIAQRAGHRR